MSDTPPVIYMLAGVTAAGKSSISMNWAHQIRGEILSCDSVAVYRGMDIGSAKPSIAERQEIPHYGIDLVEVNELFSVADYQVYIKKTVQEMRAKKNQSWLSEAVDFICSPFCPRWWMVFKFLQR